MNFKEKEAPTFFSTIDYPSLIELNSLFRTIYSLYLAFMDRLSVTVSCIAVADAEGTAVKSLKKLYNLTKIPDILLSIINKVADLTLVTQDIRLNLQLC